MNKENLELIIEDFSKIEIPMTDLLFANFSLFFVKSNFNDFKIFYFSEEKYYYDTTSGDNIFCHVYTVIAQKK